MQNLEFKNVVRGTGF